MNRRSVEWTIGGWITLGVFVATWWRTPADGPPLPRLPAQSIPTTPSKVDPIADDIHRLAIDDPAAVNRLTTAGETALPSLRKLLADSSADPQARLRAAAVIAAVIDHAAMDGSTVTLRPARAGMPDVIRQLPGGDRIFNLPPTLPVNVAADRAPFWEVFSDICRQARVAPMIDADPSHGLSMARSDTSWLTDAPHQTPGPFWVGVVGLSRSSSVDYESPTTMQATASVRLVVLPEPKIRVLDDAQFVPTAVIDDAGRSLVESTPFDRTAKSAVILVPLKSTDPPGKRIAVFRGNVFVTVAQGVTPIVVQDVLSGPKTIDAIKGCQLTIRATRRSTDLYQVEITADRVWVPDQEWSAFTQSIIAIQLSDAAGVSLPGVQWSKADDDSPVRLHTTGLFTTTLFVDRPDAKPSSGPPAVLHWDVPSRFRTATVPVELRDVPMP